MFEPRSIVSVFVLAIAAEIAMPYVKPPNGQCASGYVQSGSSYCIPARADAKPAIPKVGQCPSGYRSEAHACVRMR